LRVIFAPSITSLESRKSASGKQQGRLCDVKLGGFSQSPPAKHRLFDNMAPGNAVAGADKSAGCLFIEFVDKTI
jgi:hypothetical protein